MDTSEATQAEVKKRGLTRGPRITPDLIDSMISEELYLQPNGTTMTLCLMTLTNGYIVTGESSALSSVNFSREMGQKIARDKARNKVGDYAAFLAKELQYREAALPTVQAMFECRSKDDVSGVVTFTACTNGPHDWSEFTPSGELTMYITNGRAFDAFDVGTVYRLDFIEQATE